MLSRCNAQLGKERFIPLLIALGDLFRQYGELSRAEVMYTVALAQGELHNELSATGEALIRRGDIYASLGRRKDSNADLSLSRKIYRSLKEKSVKEELGIGRAESILGINYAVGGDVKKAQTYLKRALQSFERNDETLLSGIAQMNLGVVQKILGDCDGALAQFQRARALFEQVGDLARLAEVHYKLGMTLLQKQVFGEALREFEKSGALGAKTHNRKLSGLAFLGKANTFFSLSDIRTSLALVEQSLECFSVYDDKIHLADAYRLKGAIHRELGKVELAHWYLFTSLKIHLEMENIFKAGECYNELGRLHIVRLKPEEAKHALQKSFECFKKVAAAHDAKRVSIELKTITEQLSHEIRRSRQTKI